MFGFFKNKTKDKVVNKDKNSDSGKEKKKDKTNKDDKEVKVNVRKDKNDKTSRSIFRKSKSLERAKESNDESGTSARKSQSIDSRDSVGSSDHEQFSRQDSAATESEEAPLSPGATGISSSSSSYEEATRLLSSFPEANGVATDQNGLKSSDSFGSSILTESLTSSQDGELHTKSDGPEEQQHSTEALSTTQTNNNLTSPKDVVPTYNPKTKLLDSSLKINTHSAIPRTIQSTHRKEGVTNSLVMKPPLNPRVVAPRGPLATTVASFNASLIESGGERDERSLTPSPAMVTPPASPGLLSSQVTLPHQNVNNSTDRPTSPDGRTSMLSTPSSSTSSLSSLTARPISPSGRRTPPGPRMGTGGRLTSSPTANRKAVRTNIKTNPSMGSRRAGSHSPVNSPPSPGGLNNFNETDNLKTPPSSPIPLRQGFPQQMVSAERAEVSHSTGSSTDLTSKLVTFSPPIPRRGMDILSFSAQTKNSLPSLSGNQVNVQGSSPSLPPVSLSGEGKPEGSSSPASQRSVSPTVGKTRHSISSMHSLESIPENDSDGQSPITDENTLKESEKLCTTKGPKEHPDSKGTRPLRHSLPEVTLQKPQNHGSSHKRSSSLTPVNEERRIQFSVSISETKSVATGSPEDKVHQDCKLDNGAVKPGLEKSVANREKYDNIYANKNIKDKKEFSKKVSNSASNAVVRKDKIPSLSPKEVMKKTNPEERSSIEQPESGITAKANTLHLPSMEGRSEENGKDLFKLRPTTVNEDQKQVGSQKEQDNEPTTHVVFRIPFRTGSLPSGDEKHQRSSVEILHRDSGRKTDREKEHCKKRPRSVSTSRELRKARTSERISRKRILSEGNESKSETAMSPKEEGKKEITRQRVRSRSSSSTRAKDSTSEQIPNDISLVSNENDSYDGGDEEVIIPWRKAPRSRSKAIKVEDLKDAATTISEKPSTSTPEEGPNITEVLDKTNTEIGDTKDTSSRIITAPPRQRSKSRGAERRMTRSVTLSEIKRDGEKKSTSSEQQPQRRSRSSSRLQETTRHPHEDRCAIDQQTQDGGSSTSQAPQRRRVLTKKRSVSARREDDGKRRSTEVNSKQTNQEQKTISSKESHQINNLKTKKNETSVKESSQVKEKKKDTENRIRNHECVCKVSVETTSVEVQTVQTKTESIFCQTENEHELQFSQHDLEEHTRRELGAQEERYQKQIDELTLSLAQKQEEVSKLSQTLETLKDVQQTLNNTEELQEKLSLLQQDVRDRNAQLDCARSELETSKEEMELTKAKLKKLEEDLDAARQKNLSLQNQITAKTNCDKTEELEEKIKSMEETLKATIEERDKLTKTIDETEAERDEEIKIIQDALDEAAQEREDLIATFEKEIQNMTTMNTTREQQLMEDFEWKLREMEKDHKKKMEERDRKAEERISAVRNMVESELADSLIQVAEDRRLADEQLMEVGHLKSYEAEAIQLRGVTHELQKALRASAREMEHLKVREKILEEEIRGLKKTPASRQGTLQRAKRQAEETEAEFRQKQEKMKNELNAEWEDKLRSECSRLKAELDELHAEEKHLAVESMKVQKEQEISKLKQSWEQRQEEMTKEMSNLKDSLTEKDAYYHKEMDNMRTNADRDVWELRRKLQRMDEKNWSQQELLQEKHHEELEKIRSDYKERLSDLETRLDVATKNSDEEARQEAEKLHNEEVEHLCEQHRLSMERLREELDAEKFQAVEEARVIVTKHHEYVNSGLRDQITEAINNSTQCREELETVKSTLAQREEAIKTLEEELARLKEVEGVTAASYKDSQSSIASSSDSTCSQGSNNSQDRLSLSESVSASIDSQDDPHKSGGSGLLGKMFGGNWFSGSKTKENNRRGSAPAKQSS